MRKNGRTLREDIRLIQRGIREFGLILPGQMKSVLIRSILDSCIPYIAVLASAMIINELTQGQDKRKLFWLCLLAVGASCCLSALKYYLDAKIAVGYSHLFSAHEIFLTEKSYRLPYEILESNEAKALREQVSGSINLSGGGIASLYWDMDVVFRNLCSAMIAFILCMDFFKEVICWNILSRKGLLDSVSILFILGMIVAACSYISCKMTAKRFDVSFPIFRDGARHNRYGEFYMMNYLPDEDAALDVRIFHQEKLILEESQKKCYEFFAKGKKKEMRAVNRYEGVKIVCSGLCGIAVYGIVGEKALSGAIGIGNIVIAYAAVTMLITALSGLSEIITDLRNNNEHLLRFFQYMDLPEREEKKKQEEERKQEKEKKQEKEEERSGGIGKEEKENGMDGIGEAGAASPCGGIVFSHVSFRYPESTDWVLEDINLSIAPGEKLAIVGENGSGKTTLIQLLCRFYQPTEGAIFFNGKNIQKYPYDEYIKMISTVFQDFSLFAFPLAENVAASKGYEAEKVENALVQAGLKEKLECLPKGIGQCLFHDFEEDGVDLSGGEAQKAAIARAIYKNAEIMILDEPTAALDPYAEYEIYKNFHSITSGKTALSISHRLSSCRICDKIAVMEKGRIVQYGTHAELLGQEDRKYYEMWQAQAQYYTEKSV